jgi:chemotaxis protein MotC
VQALHDQMALGSRAAQRAMPGLLRRLGGRLMAERTAVWRDPRNIRAVVVYLLSGGETRVARKVLTSAKCTPQEKHLIEGALAYLGGNKAMAKAMLSNIDPRALEPSIGSQLALAQATLIAEENPAKAIRLLDLARVIAPGTLVEETALRREIFLTVETGDFDKFVAMSDQYLRRFRHSVYAEGFGRSFAVSVIRVSQSGNAHQFSQLVELLADMGSRDRLELYLNIARSSLAAGKLDAARWGAGEAIQLAQKNSVDANRAALYDGAVAILTSDYDRGLAEIDKLNAAHLPHDDLLLKEAVLGLAVQIRQWPSTPAQANQQTAVAAVAPRLPRDTGSAALPPALKATVVSGDALIASAQTKLAGSDMLLEEQ